MKHKQKELSIKDAAVVCDRCQSEVALLKTLKYMANDKHHAKCSFGFLRRVEIDTILKDENKIYLTDEANKGFIDCHMEQWKEEDADYFAQMNQKKPMTSAMKPGAPGKKAKPKYAFCECTHHHIVGYIIDERFYLSDISEVKLMFPMAHYEEWCERFWLNDYKAATDLQTKLNYARASQSIACNKNEMRCELCFKNCNDPDEFVLHCKTNIDHKRLIAQYSDESYDAIFEELDRQAAAEAEKLETKMQVE